MNIDKNKSAITELLNGLLQDENFQKKLRTKYGVCPKNMDDKDGLKQLFETNKFQEEKADFNKKIKKETKKKKKLLTDMTNDILENDAKQQLDNWNKNPNESKLTIDVFATKANISINQDIDEVQLSFTVLKACTAALSLIKNKDVQKYIYTRISEELNI